jgi:hypothetical protein
MTEREIHDMSRAIGALESSVKNLTDTWVRQDREATEGRKALYGKVEELKIEVTTLSGRMAFLERGLAAITPSVETFESLHDQGVGSKKTIAIVWTALITLIGAVAAAGVEIFHLLWPPRH